MQSVNFDYRPTESQTRVWVDTDITMGDREGLLSFRDVDDGYALSLLFRSQEVDLIGISSTLGNTENIDVSTEKAEQLVKTFGPNSLSVYRGARAPYLQSVNSHPTPDAVEALYQALTQGPLTILAIGALTNIALLLEKYPQVASNIEKIVCVAGRKDIHDKFISGWHQPKPFRDLNFEFDTPAFERVLDTDVPVVLTPFEVCKQLWFNFHDLIQLEKSGKLGRFLAENSFGWCAEWEAIFGAKGFNPFDLIAAAYIIQPDWFTEHHWQVTLQTGPSDTKKGEEKPYLICNESIQSGRRASYLTEIAPQAKEQLLARLCQNGVQSFILGLSHINVIVEDVDTAANYYSQVLGFERAKDEQGNLMDYRKVSMAEFNQDAGLAGQEVEVDVVFVKHPYARIYLELMKYHKPVGQSQLPPQPKTYDFGGPRHIALEVSNCNQVFHYLKEQPDTQMIDPRSDYHPEKLDGFPITFFYWIDKYGVQWEMEEGRRVGISRGIV